ncbi:integrin alpha-PS3-like, partial [Drosophila takahashii]|uniref:integrin alpha-PS3-like n=1 Tax=Drosophila takahashii TaxID=29030 RepID=UPI00389918DF
FYYMGEMGLSAHVADDNSDFLIGAPGIYNWKGAVNLYRNNVDEIIRKKTLNENSYLGYAVSSGYFDSNNLSTLYYVATAPRDSFNSSIAYIFDDHESLNQKQNLSGQQFGEYFGYSVLAEDLNGDGLTDVIISAPLYDVGNSCDNGVIYVFINKGSFKFDRTTVTSPAEGRARFGTTLSRLGDINNDGYNDVAVGAPFAGNGSVFIYLGSENGLRNKPSQRLDAPSQSLSEDGEHMFGHGMSRGSDIDGNGFNDFAIGAPNAEVVYLYRSYPIVKVHAAFNSESRHIKPDQEEVQITACYRFSHLTKVKDLHEQELDIRITMDKRAKFTENQSNERIFKAKASLDEQCRTFEIQVVRKSIFTPIELEMHYELAKKVPQTGEFCKTCVVVDPTDPNFCTERLIFTTGCASDVCAVDLQLESRDFGSTYILGSTDTLRLNYEITNSGENAHLPRFKVTSSSHLPFSQIPGNCKVDESIMICDLNHGHPLAKDDSDFVTVTFDVSPLSGQSLIIEASVFSEGNEMNSADNKQTDMIQIREFTDIDVSGGQTNDPIDLDDNRNSVEIINSYEIKSNGPSTIDQLTISINMAIAFKVADSNAVQHFITISSLKMQATYDSQLLPINLYDQNDSLIRMDTIENSSQNGQEDDDDDQFTPTTPSRKRRDLKELDESPKQQALVRTHDLPVNRTIVFQCEDFNMKMCVRAEMNVQLRPDKPITLNISFNADLTKVVGSWEYFVITTDLVLLKKGDPSSSTFVIHRKIEQNVIFRHLKTKLPIWTIIWSLIGGFLLLCAMTYALYKFGFFKRTKRDELSKLIRQSFEVDLPLELEEEIASMNVHYLSQEDFH